MGGWPPPTSSRQRATRRAGPGGPDHEPPSSSATSPEGAVHATRATAGRAVLGPRPTRLPCRENRTVLRRGETRRRAQEKQTRQGAAAAAQSAVEAPSAPRSPAELAHSAAVLVHRPLDRPSEAPRCPFAGCLRSW